MGLHSFAINLNINDSNYGFLPNIAEILPRISYSTIEVSRNKVLFSKGLAIRWPKKCVCFFTSLLIGFEMTNLCCCMSLVLGNNGMLMASAQRAQC